jgi:micrococcal nuclease
MSKIYNYWNVKILSVYDGDTVTADIDLGFYFHFTKAKLRLYGIDTPELRGPEREAGIAARDYLRELILGQEVRIETHGKGKYGRWLATIWKPIWKPTDLNLEAMAYQNINKLLVNKGFAVEYLP